MNTMALFYWYHSYICRGVTTGETVVPPVSPKLSDNLTLSQPRGQIMPHLMGLLALKKSLMTIPLQNKNDPPKHVKIGL